MPRAGSTRRPGATPPSRPAQPLCPPRPLPPRRRHRRGRQASRTIIGTGREDDRAMIEAIIEWSIRNRYLVILAAIALGIAGVRAMLTMPVDAIPDLSENQVIVFTDWMGR